MRLIRSGFCTASFALSPVEANRFSALFRNDRIMGDCNALRYNVNIAPLARAHVCELIRNLGAEESSVFSSNAYHEGAVVARRFWFCCHGPNAVMKRDGKGREPFVFICRGEIRVNHMPHSKSDSASILRLLHQRIGAIFSPRSTGNAGE